MKRIIVPALGLAVLSLVATPVIAAHTEIVGEITAIDAVAMQIIVADVTVQVTAETVLAAKGQPIAFGDLAVGMTVKVVGPLCGDVLTANRITVKYDCQ